MITTLDFGARRSSIPLYVSGDRTDVRSDVEIPVVDPAVYRAYADIVRLPMVAGAEGRIPLEWCADWETFSDTLREFNFRHTSVGVISSYASTVCALNHYVSGTHRESLDWYMGLVDGRARDTWFRTKHTLRVISAPRINDYSTRLRSILNRTSDCQLYVVATPNQDSEARAFTTLTAVYAHARKGSSVLMRTYLWELDDRILWTMAELYSHVTVKVCDCGPYMVLAGYSLRANPMKTVIKALSSFKWFAERPPGYDSVCRVLDEVRLTVINTADRIRSRDPVMRWTSEYPIPAVNPGVHLLDPGHAEDIGRVAEELPEFSAAPGLSDIFGKK